MSMPVIRLRQSAQFPANVYGDTGIAVTKANGNFTIKTDWSQFSIQTLMPSSQTNCFLNYDTASKNYVLVPTTSLQTYIDSADAANANSVKYVAQNLSSSQQTQARQNVYAAPLDALAYNGMQINGGMEISQERGTTASSTNPVNVCDGWVVGHAGSVVTSAGQALAMFANGIPYTLVVSVTTAQPSLGAGDFTQVYQTIEGYRVARLAWGTLFAQPITIGFWSAHARTGVYSVGLHNGTFNRSYIATYMQNVANTAQYNVVTVPGDTAGTWATDNTAGLVLAFAAACGSTYTAPATNTWYGANYIAAPGQVNAVAATSDVFRLTGVVVLPGIEAPSAARSALIMRPYDQELATCQRYWQKTYPIGSNPGSTTSANIGAVIEYAAISAVQRPFLQWRFPVRMRTAPTYTSYSPITGLVGAAADLNSSVDQAVSGFTVSDTELSTYLVLAQTVGHALSIHYSADARL